MTARNTNSAMGRFSLATSLWLAYLWSASSLYVSDKRRGRMGAFGARFIRRSFHSGKRHPAFTSAINGEGGWARLGHASSAAHFTRANGIQPFGPRVRGLPRVKAPNVP